MLPWRLLYVVYLIKCVYAWNKYQQNSQTDVFYVHTDAIRPCAARVYEIVVKRQMRSTFSFGITTTPTAKQPYGVFFDGLKLWNGRDVIRGGYGNRMIANTVFHEKTRHPYITLGEAFPATECKGNICDMFALRIERQPSSQVSFSVDYNGVALGVGVNIQHTPPNLYLAFVSRGDVSVFFKSAAPIVAISNRWDFYSCHNSFEGYWQISKAFDSVLTKISVNIGRCDGFYEGHIANGDCFLLSLMPETTLAVLNGSLICQPPSPAATCESIGFGEKSRFGDETQAKIIAAIHLFFGAWRDALSPPGTVTMSIVGNRNLHLTKVADNHYGALEITLERAPIPDQFQPAVLPRIREPSRAHDIEVHSSY